MVTEEKIKKLAYTIWEQEGYPEGKDIEHYFRAKKILEEQESARVIELGPPLPIPELAPQPPVVELPPPPQKRKVKSRHRKK